LRSAFLFLRSALLMVLIVVATVLWVWVCMLAAPFKYSTRYWVTSRWNVFVVWCAKTICGIDYRIKGAENLPDTPAIVLCKHQSAWETIFMLSYMPRPLVYVFKREILWIPFFGWGMALLRMIPIDRSRGRNAFTHVVNKGRKRLADGQWIIMFPEGTRIPVGQKGKYKSGGTRLAIETNTVVIPVALNSGERWPKNSFLKRPGVVTVSIGKPISPENHTPESLMQEVENWIESEMRVISPHVYSAG
jgi:1-acyl-sn-glycerol-3-phosphate acyltransferase